MSKVVRDTFLRLVAFHFVTIFGIEVLSTPKSFNIFFALSISTISALSNSSISPQTKSLSLTVIPPSPSTLLIAFFYFLFIHCCCRPKIDANSLTKIKNTTLKPSNLQRNNKNTIFCENPLEKKPFSLDFGQRIVGSS